MKRSIVYASALAVLLTSCSKEDGPALVVDQGQAGGAVGELRISLASDVSTKATGDESGTGSENDLHETYVFVSSDATGPDAAGTYEYQYDVIKLTKNQKTATVKHAQQGSLVYVIANAPYMTGDVASELLTEVNKGDKTPDQVFQSKIYPVNKPYTVNLNTTDGEFMMSGRATVPTTAGTGATTLKIPVKRDLSKVKFTVSNKATKGENKGSLRIKEVKEITVRRAADKVKPFAVSGKDFTTYGLPYGFGEKGYVQDGFTAGSPDGTFTPNNTTQTTGATDFSFLYPWTNTVDGDFYVFSDFYILPNAADVANKGTIIVLKASIEERGDASWTDVAGDRYFKARVSAGPDAFATAQNARYLIKASITGKGNDKPTGPDGPDKEDTEHDLNISVEVQPWTLFVSEQPME